MRVTFLAWQFFVAFIVFLSLIALAGCAETSRTEGTTGASGANTTAEATAPEDSAASRGKALSGGEGADSSATGTGEGTETSTASPDEAAPYYGYTYGQPSGNRVVEGSGTLLDSAPVDVELGGEPAWVVGVPVEDDTAWVVALEDGRIEAFRLGGKSGSVRPWPVSPDRLPAGQPPAVAVEGEKLRLLISSGDGASILTHPVPLPAEEDENLLVLGENGAAFLERGGGFAPVGSPQVRALPDARAVRGLGGRIALLSGPTDRYAHGILGDGLEAEGITVLEPAGDAVEVVGRFSAESGGVFESVSPLWFEGPNGEEFLAVTESASGLSSRIAVYDPDGTLVAAGPFVGEPMRWRHLLAAGPFGPNGELELAATLTPHIGGVIEFYRLSPATGELRLAATRPGYTSHRIYTRNLDTARAGDLDGDGRWELLVPNQSYTELSAVRHEEGGARVAWMLPVGGTIVTNLASATDTEGGVLVVAGRADGVLRIWR